MALQNYWDMNGPRSFGPVNPAQTPQGPDYSFNPYNPQPSAIPGWNPIWTNDMAMSPGVDKKLAEMQGYKKFKNEALRTGPSEWADRATAQQAQEAGFARDRGAGEVAGRTATARANLAMRGGFGGGASERLEKAGMSNYMDMSQNVGQEQARNTMQIGMNDEQNRMQQVGMLNELDMNRLKLSGQANQFDATAGMANNQAYNNFNKDIFDTKMSAWGAKQNADTQRKEGGGSFICTALYDRGLITNAEMRRMSDLLVHSWLTRADAFAWYLKVGQKAVDAASADQSFDWKAAKIWFIDDILALDWTDEDQLLHARNTYIARAGAFCAQFLGWRESGYQHEYAEPGFWKSLIMLPVVFMRPAFWRWALPNLRPSRIVAGLNGSS
jgi:hypothetical protein